MNRLLLTYKIGWPIEPFSIICKQLGGIINSNKLTVSEFGSQVVEVYRSDVIFKRGTFLHQLHFVTESKTLFVVCSILEDKCKFTTTVLVSRGLGPRTDALWNLDLMKDHEGPKDCSSVAVCYKIAYDQNCSVARFRVSSIFMSYGCPMSRGWSLTCLGLSVSVPGFLHQQRRVVWK